MSYPTDLTDEQWAILEPLLQRADGPGRPTVLDPATDVLSEEAKRASEGSEALFEKLDSLYSSTFTDYVVIAQ